MKNALSNVNGWLGGLTGLLKTVVVFFVFAAIVWPTGLPNVIGGIVGLVNNVSWWWLSWLVSTLCFLFIYGLKTLKTKFMGSN